MPVIKSAIKKLRHDKVKEKENNLFRKNVEIAVNKATKTQTPKTISEAFSIIDKGVKKHLIHKNKANRMKSKLNRPGTKESKVAAVKDPVKKAAIKSKTTKTKSVKKPVKKSSK